MWLKPWEWLAFAGFFTGLAAGALGCSADPLAGGACVTNQNCPGGQQCVGGQCVGAAQPAGCDLDDDCNLGEVCDPATRACKPAEVTGCSTDEACPRDQRCNTLTGVCIDGRRTCANEGQCAGIGRHCDLALQQCVDCVDETHCSAPTSACAGGACVDPNTAECIADAECAPPATVCRSMRCVAGCAQPGSPESCGPGEFCNTGTGRCDAGQVTCGGDQDCRPPSSICESGQCIPGCTQPGGLQCTGGFVCNSARGRCEAGSGCASDRECGAPAGVCESGSCVPGCGQPGGLSCASGTVCDTSAGRCVNVQGPCSSDANCAAPQSVCELGQCVPGCSQIGGIQCSGGTTCNQGTGRCGAGGPSCATDAQCNPPSTICTAGACSSGCGATGCASPLTCNGSTGRCDPGNPGGGTLALNAACTQSSGCASNVCFEFPGSVGRRCVSACGNSQECPASFTCYDYNGGKMCLSSQLFTGATFSSPNGASCTEGGQCHSNFCPDQAQCIESCSENSDCGGGQCKWYEFATDLYTAACNGPAGAGGNGASCAADSSCRGGVCYGTGTCGDLCGSTADCPQGNVCSPVNYSICAVPFFGGCAAWEINFVKACVQAAHGSTPMGGACAGGADCRDGFCNTQAGTCTGVCSRNADCPANHVCGVELYGTLADENVYFNACLPR